MAAHPYIPAMRWSISLLILILPAGAIAADAPRATQALTYRAYVAGMPVFNLDVDLELQPDRYRVDLASRTTGMYGVLFRGETQTVAQGSWAGNMPLPQRYAIAGHWRGTPRRTLMDYAAGIPSILHMEPPNEAERELVPPDQQRGTVDTVSAAAMLVRQVTTTRSCDGAARTFDGRRLTEISVQSAGWEALPSTSRSSYAGPALRCDFEGQLIAGFLLNSDRGIAAKPQRGTAWLASALPGGPMVPVRLTFDIRWFGHATMYLTSAQSGGPPLVPARADVANGAAPLRAASAPPTLAPAGPAR